MLLNKTLEDLKNSLKQLPGVGDKTAQRYALHLLNSDKGHVLSLADSIKQAVEKHDNCSSCNILSDTEPCPICLDNSRDGKLLCVVENTYDVYLLEQTGDYSGYYFVLGHLLSPMDGYGIDEINLSQLAKVVEERDVEEIILALNPSTEGETTITLIAEELGKNNNRKITRLSTGLPFGSNIEYTSSVTLSNAIQRRYSIT